MNHIENATDLRQFMGCGGDNLNIFIATSTAAFNEEDEEQIHLSYATRLQIEGFVIQPRHLRVTPVEIITEDADEARYILHCVQSSQMHLAQRQATAVMLADQAIKPWPIEPNIMQPWERYMNLGGALEETTVVE